MTVYCTRVVILWLLLLYCFERKEFSFRKHNDNIKQQPITIHCL